MPFTTPATFEAVVEDSSTRHRSSASTGTGSFTVHVDNICTTSLTRKSDASLLEKLDAVTKAVKPPSSSAFSERQCFELMYSFVKGYSKFAPSVRNAILQTLAKFLERVSTRVQPSA